MAPRSSHGCVLFVVLAMALASLIPGHLMTGPARAAGIDVKDDITENTTWTIGSSPVHVTSSITVDTGYTLVIEQGVTVKFDEWTELTVEGTLRAPGKVIFTSSSLSPQSGDWYGLTFEGADQAYAPLTNVEIHYASTSMDISTTALTMTGMVMDHFSYSALDMNSGSAVTISNSIIDSTESIADGIECGGTLQASGITIGAGTGISAESACSGLVDKSIITAYTWYGVETSSGSTLRIENSLINSTNTDSSTGIYVYDGAKTTIKGDDIVDVGTGIYWDSAFGKIEGSNVRNCARMAIEADTAVTVTGSFVASPSPTTGTSWDGDITDKVTITSPLTAPIDVLGISQPPTVWIKTPAARSSLTGKVSIEGQAWDPDAGDTISSVEARVFETTGGSVMGWTKCTGTADWKCTWDSATVDSRPYTISARVMSGKDSKLSNSVAVTVAYQGGNITNPYDFLGLYTTICIGGIVAVIVVIIIIVVVVVVVLPRKKGQAPQQQAYQQPYQASYQPYPQQQPYAQPQPGYQATPIPPEPAKPAPTEEFIIEDVFLIYRDGRLIHHDTRRLKPEVDDQMLSGMFTAIQEFIGQSFPAEDGTKGMVKEIMYGDSRVILEHGNYVYLAVVTGEITDTKPVHRRMGKLIKEIEGRCVVVLQSWDGNMDSVHDAKRMVKLIYNEEDIDNFV